jgi:hypothetical protein
MRNEPVTPFWKDALESLPASLRARYAHDIAAAERWELRIDAIVQAWTRVKAALGRAFQTPRSAH